ncbi:hypothetical protein C8Q73DRAFT_793029 [Cubamyces lactineus]|nr:hypothetical protein C8Q73DRAFT_793029 [Cubamyces lactineus]
MSAVGFNKYVLGAEALRSEQDVAYLRIARGGYLGKQVHDRRKVRTVANLLEKGFTYFAWDGKSPHVLLDAHGRILAILAGHPADGKWNAIIEEASEAMERARKECELDDGKIHRRGKFATLARGVSFGGGQTAPTNMGNDAHHEEVLSALCGNKAIQRLAGFGSSVLSTYAPRVYERMQDRLGTLYQADPSLQKNFKNSIYPAASFNFGRKTVCYPHTDAANDPCNYCQITALGRYDPRRSAHFVMYDSELIIEFPPGATIFTLSAIERHGNTPLEEGETRQSFMQYCAGGLLRWVEAGLRTQVQFQKDDPDGASSVKVKSYF